MLCHALSLDFRFTTIIIKIRSYEACAEAWAFLFGGERMTGRQSAFARHYACGESGTQAAIKAGYAEVGAGQQANKLLKNAEVLAEIDRIKAEIEKEGIADRTEVLKFLTKVMRGEIKERKPYVNSLGELDYSECVNLKLQVEAAKELARCLTNNGLPSNVRIIFEDDL